MQYEDIKHIIGINGGTRTDSLISTLSGFFRQPLVIDISQNAPFVVAEGILVRDFELM